MKYQARFMLWSGVLVTSLLTSFAIGRLTHRESRMNAKYLEGRALIAQGQGKLTAARDAFRKSAELDTDKMPALTGVVQCDVLLGDAPEFKEDWKKLLILGTVEAKAEAHFWLAIWHWRKKDYAPALHAFDVAISFNHPDAPANLAQMRLEMN